MADLRPISMVLFYITLSEKSSPQSPEPIRENSRKMYGFFMKVLIA